MKEPVDKPITIVTPPDILFASGKKIMLFGPGNDWKNECIDYFYKNWNDNLVLYYTENEKENLEWLFSVSHLVNVKIFHLNSLSENFHFFFTGLNAKYENSYISILDFHEDHVYFLEQFSQNEINFDFNQNLYKIMSKYKEKED